MKDLLKGSIRPLLYTLGGAVFGAIYYYLVGCKTGNCIITSSLGSSMAYMAFFGFLFSGSLCSSCRGGSCDIGSHKDNNIDE